MKNRTLEKLCELDGRVYVCLADGKIAGEFMRQAEGEGFLFADGVKPTQRAAGGVMAVNRGKTVNFVGHVGMTAFGGGAKTIGSERLIRVDYEKYNNGEEDYIL